MEGWEGAGFETWEFSQFEDRGNPEGSAPIRNRPPGALRAKRRPAPTGRPVGVGPHTKDDFIRRRSGGLGEGRPST